MDLRNQKSDNLQTVIKSFEDSIGRKVYAVFENPNTWLIESVPKGSSNKFAVDPYYTVNKKTGSIMHFNPCNGNKKDLSFFNDITKNPVYKVEGASDEKDKEEMEEFFDKLGKKLYGEDYTFRED